MENSVHLHYDVDGDDFTRAGEASSDVKHKLKKLNVPADAIRRIAIAMYEGEINMVVHANGGVIDVYIYADKLTMILNDVGPGIQDVSLAIQEGWSTASPEVRELGFGAGMGLPNMKRSSDEMDIETEVGVGTKIKMTVYY